VKVIGAGEAPLVLINYFGTFQEPRHAIRTLKQSGATPFGYVGLMNAGFKDTLVKCMSERGIAVYRGVPADHIVFFKNPVLDNEIVWAESQPWGRPIHETATRKLVARVYGDRSQLYLSEDVLNWR
jgi:hypothetical protein